ncbi:MAG: hypothetical protein CMN97_05455 [Synechococcus sp. NAT40]|nr:hypothetical protein [Synechococcus sp. NAT40]
MFQHWRLAPHLSQNKRAALLLMRSSYEVRLESPGGAQRFVVRASSRSDACRMAAEAHPGCAFVVVGRIGDGIDCP